MEIMINIIKKNINNFRFIHIGKCGGQTIKHFFNLYDTKIKTYHVFDNIEFNHNLQYIICIRNPILRAISAFNFRYQECHEVPRTKYHLSKENEEDILLKYKTLDKLAFNLYNSGIKNTKTHKELFTIGHIEHNIAYYLKNLLDKISPNQILFVFKQENLNEDIKTFFNVQCITPVYHHKLNKKKYLTKTSYKNLKKALSSDYQCLSKLIEWNKIDKDFIKFYKK